MEGTWVTAHSHHMSWRVLTSEWGEDLGSDLGSSGPRWWPIFFGARSWNPGNWGNGKAMLRMTSHWVCFQRVEPLKWRMISLFDHLRSVSEVIFGLTPIAGFVLFMGKSYEKMDDLGRATPWLRRPKSMVDPDMGENLQDLTDARLLYSDIKQWENPWDSDG